MHHTQAIAPVAAENHAAGILPALTFDTADHVC